MTDTHRRPFEMITFDVEDHVATITLNIPDRKNPLGPEMVNDLLWALDDCHEDADVRVVVITGAGDSFSSGADLKRMTATSTRPSQPPLEVKGDYADLLLRFTTLGKPTIAKVRGVAFGGGLGIVGSCDLAIAGKSAVFGTPEIKRGLFPMMIMGVLARIVPRRKLVEMMLLGEKVEADKALELGLVSHVVADAKLDKAVDELAAKLASMSPTAMKRGLHALHHHADRVFEEALPDLRQALFELLSTDDAQEGLFAFMEKREPVWKGR